VQVAYAIGVKQPMNLYVNTYGTSKVKVSDSQIAERLLAIFDMTPYTIETKLKLRNPIYQETAAYGHMGRQPETITKSFPVPNSNPIVKQVELFTWEKLDLVDSIRAAIQ